MTQFVSQEDVEAFTGKKRYSAQARWLADRRIAFMQHDDGSIVLRQDEMDRHTLSKPDSKKPVKDWRRNLAELDSVG
jgi:hypothetical protein